MTQFVLYRWLKVFLKNIFIRTYFYVYEKRFPRGMLYCSTIKLDFAALTASARFSLNNINLRWIDWWEIVLSKPFNNHFVILYTKAMLQISGHIIQTIILIRTPNPITSTGLNSSHILLHFDSSDSSVWPGKWTFYNWPNTIRTAFTIMRFKESEWCTFHLVAFWSMQQICNSISWPKLDFTLITAANPML